MSQGDPAPEQPSDETPSLIKPGGKVDPEALRQAAKIEETTGEDDGLRRATFTLGRDLRKRLDRYLKDRIDFMSRNQLQRLITEGGVTVNGRAAKASTSLRLGDVVEVVIPPPPAKEIQPEEIPLEVLYEDEQIIVINKQADIIVHPARSHLGGTMLNALAWHFLNESDSGGALSNVGAELARPGVVHRLDRHTTGVIIFAKDEEAHWRLGRQFEQRTTDKRYLALVQGEVEPVADLIDAPLGPHPSSAKGLREKYVVRYDEMGKASLTLYRVRERFEGYSLVELELKTGRTHQIRIHMTHLGYPLVGDDMYSGKPATSARLGKDKPARLAIEAETGSEVIMDRQALHATTLTIDHPKTGERMTFQAPVPPDLARLVDLLRRYRPGEGPLSPAGSTIDPAAVIPDSGNSGTEATG